MADSETVTRPYNDQYGHPFVRTVNYALNAQDFKDTPGYAWLLIAANPHLSANDLQDFLTDAGMQHKRSVSWIRRHRWLFSDPSKAQARGPKLNTDGLDNRALKVIAENPRMSSRQLAGFLRKNGVPRSAEWVRRNRLSAGPVHV